MRVAFGLGAIQLGGDARLDGVRAYLDCALPVAFGGSSGLRTGLTAGLYLGAVMAGTEAGLRLVPGSG
jgi:hypothetical protein